MLRHEMIVFEVDRHKMDDVARHRRKEAVVVVVHHRRKWIFVLEWVDLLLLKKGCLDDGRLVEVVVCDEE